METVTIDADCFIEMLWNRVREFYPARGYDNDFWTECFEYLKEVGFLRDDIQHNTPSYIVDNIAINGAIYPIDECAENYKEIEEDYNGSVEDWYTDKGYMKFGNYIVVNLGL